MNVSCQDDWGATGSDNLQVNISAPYGAGAAGTCDLGCIQVSPGCTATVPDGCTLIAPT